MTMCCTVWSSDVSPTPQCQCIQTLVNMLSASETLRALFALPSLMISRRYGHKNSSTQQHVEWCAMEVWGNHGVVQRFSNGKAGGPSNEYLLRIVELYPLESRIEAVMASRQSERDKRLVRRSFRRLSIPLASCNHNVRRALNEFGSFNHHHETSVPHWRGHCARMPVGFTPDTILSDDH